MINRNSIIKLISVGSIGALFPFVRQIIFFPYISKNLTSEFALISVLIVSIDVFYYSVSGGLSDYYVRSVKPGVDHIKERLKFSGIGQILIPFILIASYLAVNNLLNTLLIATYIYVSMQNALLIKSKMIDRKYFLQYLYNIIRVFPYLLFLATHFYITIDKIQYFIILLLGFEIVTFLIVFFVVGEKGKISISEVFKLIDYKSLFSIVIVYGFLGYLQRLEVFLFEWIFKEEVEALLKLFFVTSLYATPVTLIMSSGVFTYLAKVDSNTISKFKNKMYAIYLVYIVVMSIIFLLTADKISLLLYDYSFSEYYNLIASVLLFLGMVSFYFFKPFILKYSSNRSLLIYTFSVLALIMAITGIVYFAGLISVYMIVSVSLLKIVSSNSMFRNTI